MENIRMDTKDSNLAGADSGYSWRSLVPDLTAPGFFLIFLVLLGIGVRLLHLIPGGYHHILGTDSYWFHHMAESPGVVEGSGLVYPIYYLGKLIGLEAACLVVPVLVGVAGILGIYWAVSRIFDPLTGLCAAGVWALLPNSVIITAAGFIDRDGLSVLLVSVGVFIFWFLKDKYWPLAGLLPVYIGLAIQYEWVYIGWGLMVVIIFAVFIGLGILRLGSGMRIPSDALMVIVLFSYLIWLVQGELSANASQIAEMVDPASAMSTTYSEISHLTPQYIVAWYGLFMLPVLAGAVMVIKNRTEAGVFGLSWFMAGLFLGIMAERCLIFALPGACMLAGMALSGFIRETWAVIPKRPAMAILGACMVMLLAASFVQGARLAEFHRMAPDNDWLAGLEYLKEETPEDARILCHWDFGYWVLDLADRQPILRGGMSNTENYNADDLAATLAAYDEDYYIGPVDNEHSPLYSNSTIMVLKGG